VRRRPIARTRGSRRRSSAPALPTLAALVERLKPRSRGSKTPPSFCDPSARPLSKKYLGQRVLVHVNLHNGCYAVTVGRRVVGYTDGLRLADVTARVRSREFERCQEEQVRNVHAWLLGTLTEIGARADAPVGWTRLRYNCLRQRRPCFLLEGTETCFVSAPEVIALPGGRVWANVGPAAPSGALRALALIAAGGRAP
jgi:hypothetical protein